jgi:hypothetical protein
VGIYSLSYKIQFTANFVGLRSALFGKQKTEPKCRFFTWTLLHQRVLTADNLQKRGWPCNPICNLCNSSPDTAVDLCKDCPFNGRVWDLIPTWAKLPFLSGVPNSYSIYAWWRRLRSLCNKDSRKTFDSLIIYFWWHICLEWNNRVFHR